MSTTAPGWYPDPQNPTMIRFYDGDQWTAESAPTPTDGKLPDEVIARGHAIMAGRAQEPAGASAPPAPPSSLGQTPDADLYPRDHQVVNTVGSQPYRGYAEFEAGRTGDGADVGKTPGWVWPVVLLAGAASVVLALGGGAMLGDDGADGSAATPDSGYVDAGDFTADAQSLPLESTYTCDGLFADVSELGPFQDTDGNDVVAASSPALVRDARDSFEIPSEVNTYEPVLVCSGDAEYTDGATGRAEFELNVDSAGDMWVLITPRN